MILETLHLRTASILLCIVFLAFLPACKSSQPTTSPENITSAPAHAIIPVAESAPSPAEIDPSVLDRLKNESWHGDLAGLVQRRYIRVLVSYNKTNFFYDGPQPRGVTYESLREFEKFLNTKLHTGDKPLFMVFIPVTHEEGFKRMSDGRGDIAASNIPIVPRLAEKVDFSDPVREHVKQIIVTGPAAPRVTTLEDLSGKEVFVRKISRYWPNLEKLNEQFKASGKPPIVLKEADINLQDEDILDMVNAGVVGITVMDDLVAGFWSKVYDGLTVHADIEVANGDQIGWAVQKNTPEFKKIINEFVAGHKVGTSFGNVVLQRYRLWL